MWLRNGIFIFSYSIFIFINLNTDQRSKWKSKKIPEKKLLLFHWLRQKPLTVWITTNCRKFLKRSEYQTTLTASWEICMQVKKQQLEQDLKQWTGSKLKGLCKGCILLPCLFNLYAKYINWNVELDAQAGIKIAERNINKLKLKMIPL